MFWQSAVEITTWLQTPVVVATAAKVWWDVNYVKKNMATKHDVKLAVAEVQKWTMENFVQRGDCREMRTTKPNGGVHPSRECKL